MVMSVQDALSRVVGLFGPQATWDPTKLYGNVMVSPKGNLVIHSTVDDNSGATVQVTGQVKTQSLAIDYPASYSTLYFNNNGKMRWTVYRENTAESGSNAGSNFGINSVADDGSTQTTVLNINRASGLLSVYKGISITGGSTLGGNTSTTGTITQTVNSGSILNYMNAPAGQYKGIYFQTSGSARWVVMSESTAESGSNVGSNFAIGRYTDAGVWIDNAIYITRSDASIAITGMVNASKAGSGTGVLRCTGDNGTSWANWSGSSTTALQVDCANPQSAYMALRWTQWGSRHLAAINAYAGGSTSSTCMINFAFNSNPNSFMFYDGGNSTFAGSATVYSDYRVKTNIDTLEPNEVLGRLMKMRSIEFDRTDSPELHTRQPGFIAHEVQDIFPLLVKGEKDAMKTVKRMVGDTTAYPPGEEPEGYEPPHEIEELVPDVQSVNYVGMVAYLTSAVQALNDKLEGQAAEIERLKELVN
jgi:hypothetical protein